MTTPYRHQSDAPIRVPIGALASGLQVLARHGLDTDRLLGDVGIDPAVLADVDYGIELERYYKFIDYIIEKIQIPGFGLAQGRRDDCLTQMVAGTAVFSAPTLGAALTTAMAYQKLIDPTARIDLDTRGDHAVLTVHGPHHVLRYVWGIEKILGGLVRAFKDMLGAATPRFVALELDYPDPGAADLYADVFDCPIRFNQPTNRLRFDKRLLGQACRRADTARHQQAIARYDTILRGMRADAPLAARVEAVMLVGNGKVPPAATVAARLGMPRDELDRRLAAEGLNYRRMIGRLRPPKPTPNP